MAKILHPDFILDFRYEKQVEVPGTQTVRLYRKDTAIVTALLWLKGMQAGKDGKPATPFDKKLWFSDTYVRTADGWKYAFGQASIAVPAEAPER